MSSNYTIPVYNYDLDSIQDEKAKLQKEQQKVQIQREIDEASDTVFSAIGAGFKTTQNYTLHNAAIKRARFAGAENIGKQVDPETLKEEYGLHGFTESISEGQAALAKQWAEEDKKLGVEQDLAWDTNEKFESFGFAVGLVAGFLADPLTFIGGSSLGWMGRGLGQFSKSRAARNAVKLGNSVLKTPGLNKLPVVVNKAKGSQVMDTAATRMSKLYDKTLKKQLVRESTADGIVNLGELAAINELESKYGNDINMAVFGPMAAFAPGVFRTIGTYGLKPLAKRTISETRGAVKTVKDKTVFRDVPSKPFHELEGMQEYMQETLYNLNKTGVDLHVGQVYRWLDDVDELNRLIAQEVPDAPILKTLADARSFIKSLDGETLGRVEERLLSVDEQLMDYFLANGRSAQKAVKSQPTEPINPQPTKLADTEQSLDDEFAGVHRISAEDLKKVREEDIADLSPTAKELDELDVRARALDEDTQVVTKTDLEETAEIETRLAQRKFADDDTAVVKTDLGKAEYDAYAPRRVMYEKEVAIRKQVVKETGEPKIPDTDLATKYNNRLVKLATADDHEKVDFMFELIKKGELVDESQIHSMSKKLFPGKFEDIGDRQSIFNHTIARNIKQWQDHLIDEKIARRLSKDTQYQKLKTEFDANIKDLNKLKAGAKDYSKMSDDELIGLRVSPPGTPGRLEAWKEYYKRTGTKPTKELDVQKLGKKYDEIVAENVDKSAKEAQAKIKQEEKAAQVETKPTTKKTKEVKPDTLEDIAKQADEAIMAFIKCKKGV